MKREIKFRAWDKKEKKMYSEFSLFAIKFSGELLKLSTIDDGDRSFENDYLVMQYTGLKDVNGKEIYEGDIVHWFDELGKNPLPFVVAYKTAHFVLTIPNEKLKGWNLERQKLEVIGNRFENPELLKRVKRD